MFVFVTDVSALKQQTQAGADSFSTLRLLRIVDIRLLTIKYKILIGFWLPRVTGHLIVVLSI